MREFAFVQSISHPPHQIKETYTEQWKTFKWQVQWQTKRKYKSLMF